MTDIQEQTVWRADYAPFGNLNLSVSQVGNNLRFPGQYFDEETGLHYNWHRYYDPETGRYLTPDPIGLAGGINPLLYAEANPINFIDPLGLQTIPFPISPGLPIGPLPGTVFEPGSNANNLFIRDVIYIIKLMDPRPLINDVINFWNESTEENSICEDGVTVENKKRKSKGGDGADSEHDIEKMNDKTISKTHRVTKDGKIIHQHQDHIGKFGGKRRFPDVWTGTKTILNN